MATKDGLIKKTPADEYTNVRKSGLLAITLKEDDELISVKDTKGDEDLLIVTKNGNSIRFNEQEVRTCGRTSIGVKGMTLTDDDRVVSMEICSDEETILFVSENGLGKRTKPEEFNLQGRGGKGSRGYKVSDKTGLIVGTVSVKGDEEVLLITTEGIVIRTRVDSVPILGRTTSGVKLISIDKDSEAKVASFAVIPASEEEGEAEPNEGAEPEKTPVESEEKE